MILTRHVNNTLLCSSFVSSSPLPHQIFEAIQPSYLTTADRQAGWKGVGPDEDPEKNEPKVRLIRSEKGVAYAPRFEGATLS